jgi:hypothetical protein
VTRRIKVRGIRREELDADQLAFVFFTMAKRRVKEKRRKALEERERRQRKEGPR